MGSPIGSCSLGRQFANLIQQCHNLVTLRPVIEPYAHHLQHAQAISLMEQPRRKSRALSSPRSERNAKAAVGLETMELSYSIFFTGGTWADTPLDTAAFAAWTK